MEFKSQQGQTKRARPALGPSQPPVQLAQESSFSPVKRPGREVDHALASSDENKNEWSCTTISSECLHGLYWGKFTFVILIINLIVGFAYKIISNASLSFGAECPEHLCVLHRKCTAVGTPCSKSKSSLNSHNESCSRNTAVLRSVTRFICIVCPLTDRRCSNFPIRRRNTNTKYVHESSCGLCIST